MRTDRAGGHDLRHHGDAEVRDDGARLTDLAVNVRADTPPVWLRERIAGSLTGLAAYPDGRAARAAVAARHEVPVERVLLTAGAAEAFVLLARGLTIRHPVVVHPQFTEPEAALRDAGHTVDRVLLREEDSFRLDPTVVPEDADLVVVGNPTNPTSVLHPAATIAELARPGRTLVVDEAFLDAVPGEREALAGRTEVPGLVVLRSLTKTWGLAGLGSATSSPPRRRSPPWSGPSRCGRSPHRPSRRPWRAWSHGPWRRPPTRPTVWPPTGPISSPGCGSSPRTGSGWSSRRRAPSSS